MVCWAIRIKHAGKVEAVHLVYICLLPVETGLLSQLDCHQYRRVQIKPQ